MYGIWHYDPSKGAMSQVTIFFSPLLMHDPTVPNLDGNRAVVGIFVLETGSVSAHRSLLLRRAG